MDWNRAKNIIIGLLCVLNVFLLFNYLYARHTQSEASQTQEELEIYLENRGVTLECVFPQASASARGLMVAENTESAASYALRRLLGGDVQQENGETFSETGRFSWVAGVLDGEISTLPDASEADLDSIIQLLASVGINPDRTEIQEQSAILYKDFGDPAQPVYNMSLKIAKLENGNWSISGRWFLGNPERVSGEEERDISGLLVTFTDRLLTQGAPLHTITRIESGWIASVLTNVGVKLTPAFEIETDAGIYYISALDAQPLSVG